MGGGVGGRREGGRGECSKSVLVISKCAIYR